MEKGAQRAWATGLHGRAKNTARKVTVAYEYGSRERQKSKGVNPESSSLGRPCENTPGKKKTRRPFPTSVGSREGGMNGARSSSGHGSHVMAGGVVRARTQATIGRSSRQSRTWSLSSQAELAM